MTARQPSRLQRIAKWCGTALSALILAAWMLSVPLLRSKTTVLEGHFSRNWMAMDRGVITYELLVRSSPSWFKSYSWDEGPDRRKWPFWHRYGLVTPTLERNTHPSAYFHLIMPLWLPFLVVLTSTAYLWNRDHRLRPGHCPSCNYNLTGNTSGICPECGTACKRPIKEA